MFTNVYTPQYDQHIHSLVIRTREIKKILDNRYFWITTEDRFQLKLELEQALQEIEYYCSALNIMNTFSPSRYQVYTPSRFS